MTVGQRACLRTNQFILHKTHPRSRGMKNPTSPAYNGATALADLERIAQDVVAGKVRSSAMPSEQSRLQQEIAVILGQLANVQALHEELRRSLLRAECYVDTELMQMELRTPSYSPYRYPEREKLQRRLGGIDAERRRIALIEQEKVHVLQVRLLQLMGQHAQVTP